MILIARRQACIKTLIVGSIDDGSTTRSFII